MTGKSNSFPTPQLKARISEIIEAHGRARASNFLGICTQTLKVVALGGPVHAGTIALLEKKIADRDAAGRTP
jgi:hypothetical protein